MCLPTEEQEIAIAPKQRPTVELRPWSNEDLPLLERVMGDPVMTEYLGGPETPDQINGRHERYLRSGEPGEGQMFVIVVGPKKQPAGMIGYWVHVSQGQHMHEIGWAVLREFQGQGVATLATTLAIQQVRAGGKVRFLHAFPAVENGPSNAVCRKTGFELVGQVDFEEPGQTMHCNDWRLNLFNAIG